MPHSTNKGVPQDQKARVLDDVFSIVYEELRSLASAVRRQEAGTTFSSTALVHEAWLKLKDSPHLAEVSLSHFKAIAAKAMRQVLVEAARRRNAQKRGAGEVIAVDAENCAAATTFNVDLLGLDRALKELSAMNPRQAMVIELRFFGGLTVSETAALLDVSESVVERDWRAARAWLVSVLDPGGR